MEHLNAPKRPSHATSMFKLVDSPGPKRAEIHGLAVRLTPISRSLTCCFQALYEGYLPRLPDVLLAVVSGVSHGLFPLAVGQYLDVSVLIPWHSTRLQNTSDLVSFFSTRDDADGDRFKTNANLVPRLLQLVVLGLTTPALSCIQVSECIRG